VEERGDPRRTQTEEDSRRGAQEKRDYDEIKRDSDLQSDWLMLEECSSWSMQYMNEAERREKN